MVEYSKFNFEELPKSAVVNGKKQSGENETDSNLDNFITEIVANHLNRIASKTGLEQIPFELESFSSEPQKSELSQIINDADIENPSAIQAEDVVAEVLSNEVTEEAATETAIDVEQLKLDSYNKGFSEAREEFEASRQEANFNGKLANILEEKINSILPKQDLDIQVAKISAETIAAIAKKLHLILPVNFEDILINGLVEKLKKFYKEGNISITINPERYDFCREILHSDRIPDKFKNNFQIIKDEKFGLDDCNLEWQNTRLEYNQTQLSEEIDKIIEQLKSI